MKANIKQSNYHLLKDIELGGVESRRDAHGDKLTAIYRLIQKRGEPIRTTDPNLKGVKALEFGDGEYIAMKRTGYKTGSFYPCAIKTILLTIL